VFASFLFLFFVGLWLWGCVVCVGGGGVWEVWWVGRGGTHNSPSDCYMSGPLVLKALCVALTVNLTTEFDRTVEHFFLL